MKKQLKLTLALLLSIGIFSCSTNSPVSSVQNEKSEAVKIKEQTLMPANTNKIYVAEVSKEKGASFSFNFKKSNFKTKASQDGTPAKTDNDIHHYIVYLIKNSSTNGYPAGGDPVGDKVAGPFTITDTGSSVFFTNVPPSGGKAYYVAVKAQDSSNNDLIKDNNGSATAWTGTTASGTLKVAVSYGNGITVDSSYVLNSNNSLSVSTNLLDAVGATIESNIEPNNGADKTNSDISVIQQS